MSILIIGANGSMGQRYQAIMHYLNRPYVCVDKDHAPKTVLDHVRNSEGVIIATPTDTHAEYIRKVLPYKKPILCEKPVTKNVEELKELLQEIRESGTDFRMMYQYRLLNDPNRIGITRYNYFRHGSDGLYWDCLQIIGLARSEVTLGEDSPVWRCMLNGKALSLAHMDAAYIGYVQTWLNHPNQAPNEILDAHVKTHEFAKRCAHV